MTHDSWLIFWFPSYLGEWQVEFPFAVEIKSFKQEFLRRTLGEATCIFQELPTSYNFKDSFIPAASLSSLDTHTVEKRWDIPGTCVEDIRHIADDEQRHCVTHAKCCPLPEKLDAFGAGFSCTSLSSLNGEAQANVCQCNGRGKGVLSPTERCQIAEVSFR